MTRTHQQMAKQPKRIVLDPATLQRLLHAARTTSSRDLSNRNLGRRFDIGAETVRRILKEHGVTRAKPWRRPRI